MTQPKTIARWTQEVTDAGFKINTKGMIFEPCHRCGGSGVFHFYSMGAAQTGVCFRCGGGRGVMTSVATMAKRIRARASKKRSDERKRIAARAAGIIAGTEVIQGDAELRTAFAGSKNEFIRTIARRLFRDGVLSEKQRSAVINARQGEIKFEAIKAARPAEVAIPAELLDGRTRITARVMSTKWKESDFGYTLKGVFIVAIEGGEFRLYGSVPKAMIDAFDGDEDAAADGIKGQTVSFDARVEASQDDPAFGFFKRPTKVVIEEVPAAPPAQAEKIQAPCDVILDGIEDDEKRELARGLFQYTLNTRGGVPSQAAGWLAGKTVEELRAYRLTADRRCEVECGNLPQPDATIY